MSLRGGPKARRSNLPRLYLITDRRHCRGQNLLPVVARALHRGVRLVQLREKDLPTEKLLPLAAKLQKLCKKYRAKLLINSRIDIALALNLDGVHIPQKGACLTVAETRLLLGPYKLIGASTHSLSEALVAQRAGADFITFGPIFETPEKKKYGPPLGIQKLSAICAKIRIPVFAIGGMRLNQLPLVRANGAYGLAAIRAFL